MARRRSKLPGRTQLRLIEHFVAGTTARMAAELVGVNRHTATLYYHKLREPIAERIADERPFGGEVERIAHDPDESYSGGRRKGKRGRGASGKVVVFGILKRGRKVFAAVPGDLKRATPLPIIRQRVEPESLVVTDGASSYDTLHAEGFSGAGIGPHERVSHAETLVEYNANGRAAHVNGTENFPPADGRSASQAKRQLRRCNGIPRAQLELFLKECEWRFNYGSLHELLKTLRRWTLI